ncbi:MAG: hypothetical protein HOD72_08790 [Opitutae bacterium]|jgi:hypothetical protein|nr:hypothetical protein [Opitutae bacterium]MBT4224543.1 hypothetical protein [Opitutae bacterium]MBT5379445.1 hypothetical protein [Opitutae bacterium]MBT5692049.1 hypothetical protein [Opitutae bacterium]MBT6461478.1 hypothetical protein [Opitutae bacterium]
MDTKTHPDTQRETENSQVLNLRKIQALIQHQERICEQMQELSRSHERDSLTESSKAVPLWNASRPTPKTAAKGLLEQLKSVNG